MGPAAAQLHICRQFGRGPLWAQRPRGPLRPRFLLDNHANAGLLLAWSHGVLVARVHRLCLCLFDDHADSGILLARGHGVLVARVHWLRL